MRHQSVVRTPTEPSSHRFCCLTQAGNRADAVGLAGAGTADSKTPDTYPGSCYRQFQHQLSQLRRLGYLLALNSKNDESLVQSVFEQHSGVALKWEEFSAIRANWTDKVTNLQDIAAELNLGLDSVLFIDDNDFELDLVRSALPQVRCLKMPAQPWLVPSVLPLCEWIDCLSVTAEDKIRAANYTADRQRKRLEDAATDHSAYQIGRASCRER